ncbi:tyrosine-type recombinase/integrase [Mesorhizobium captivum]|uniref:tyrosine-type recombinase/integrase n=1 Tax=Mesorhizobium captivum TaxID=3072319 RepID=UPI002A249921|nr:tyrosine-type recombinase/integrase [Mesorhizobium sp. VK3C]MDX8450591.1 tyrosine-type recombinase/integrase [Mesorhizobium sp. VK3C]
MASFGLGLQPFSSGKEGVLWFAATLREIMRSSISANQALRSTLFSLAVYADRRTMPSTYARTPRKLPAILSVDEVVQFLEAVPSLKARTALTTAYAAGLRASETVSLKVVDIDSQRMVIQVRHAKDRTVMLSLQLLAIPRTYWRQARPRNWRFPGRGDKPIDVQVLYAACRSAIEAAGLTKRVSVHTLRHYLPRPTMSSSSDCDGKCMRNKEISRRSTRAHPT